MLRIHFMQQWFGFSDPVKEEALHDVPLDREFAGLGVGITRLPDKTIILCFRNLRETYCLAGLVLASINELLRSRGLALRAGAVLDATLIATPNSTKERRRRVRSGDASNEDGQPVHFGMKAHIGAAVASGLGHAVIRTTANVDDLTQGNALPHIKGFDAFGDASY